MRAVVITEHGGYEQCQLIERPMPEPGPGEVRVALRAAGCNQLDTWVRRGVPGHTFPLPIIPGSDGAGVIDALGEGVESLSVGDEVVVLPGLSCGECAHCLAWKDPLCAKYEILGESRNGTCAEYIVLSERNVATKPENLDFAGAACISLVFMTAWSMLIDKARLQSGETVLVQAGASGVGSAAIQIAALHGARVLATAGSAEKCRLAESLGAEVAIDYRQQDFASEVRALVGPEGVDVVIEHVGAETFAGSMRCLGRGGRLVTCGATTGAEVEVNLRRLFFKNQAVIGSTMGSRGDLLRILELFAAGKLRPVLGQVLPLAEVGRAHELLESRGVLGKIVLTL